MLQLLNVFENEYSASPIHKRLIESDNANHFFKILFVGDSYYFMNAYNESDHFFIRPFDNKTLFCPLDRVYVFSNDGRILFATRVFGEVFAVEFIKGKIIVILEFSVIVLSESDLFLVSITDLPDSFVDIREDEKGIELECFGGNVVKIKLW